VFLTPEFIIIGRNYKMQKSKENLKKINKEVVNKAPSFVNITFNRYSDGEFIEEVKIKSKPLTGRLTIESAEPLANLADFLRKQYDDRVGELPDNLNFIDKSKWTTGDIKKLMNLESIAPTQDEYVEKYQLIADVIAIIADPKTLPEGCNFDLAQCLLDASCENFEWNEDDFWLDQDYERFLEEINNFRKIATSSSGRSTRL
jgi:hypothetical protein